VISRESRNAMRVMRTLRARLRLLARSERGLTLIELLVASAMTVVLFSAAIALFMTTVKSQPDLTGRSHQIETTRNTMERMIRELRQGLAVDTGTASQLAFRTYVGSTCAGGTSTTKTLCRVTYTCTGTSCTRILANPDGSSPGSPVTVISGINNPTAVFTYTGSPATYVGVRFVVPSPNGRGRLTLQDGASLRNATLNL
jgi:prepilin-type N-terminal cleavage/methylation domain-containing protein